MIMLERTLQLAPLLDRKSLFLFGPRATGKTSLIKAQLGEKSLIIDLLRTDVFLRLNNAPWELETLIRADQQAKYVVIDEIQKIPILLNEVHRLIEEKQWRFLLTGSSARSLKKAHVNLLAGRAWQANLAPLTMQEIPDFSLSRYLQVGGLPAVYLSDSPWEELKAYVGTYLIDEIQAEAAVRRIQAFTKFLHFAALTSGRKLNYSAIARDAGVSATTIREYYQILADTLIGHIVPAWTKKTKRKATSGAKFYFFDIGIMHQIIRVKSVEMHSDLYGFAFEHFIAMELKAYIDYKRLDLPLCYWCTQHGHEVDFILGDDIAIEVKTANRIASKHLKGLKYLQAEKICQRYILVSFDPVLRHIDGIDLYDWQTFLTRLWQGDITR